MSDWISAGGTAELLVEMLTAADPEADDVAGDAGEQPPPEQDSRPTFAIINPVDLALVPIPERRWIVPDWLPCGHVTGDYGDGGTGKTLLAQQLMTACATGAPWCGLLVRRCRTLGLFCEDDPDELHRRQEKINRAVGMNFSDLDGVRWISGVGADNVLVNFTTDGRMQRTDLFDRLQRAAIEHGAELVVLDTAADLLGGNENDRSIVRRFIGQLNALALAIGGAVLLNCHPSRAGLASGNLRRRLDGVEQLDALALDARTPEGDDGEMQDTNERILCRVKANYAAIGATVRLRWAGGASNAAGAPRRARRHSAAGHR